MAPRKTAVKDELQTIPGIGPSMAVDLRKLGVRRVSDLKRRNPENMYKKLCELTGVRQDPCVLYVFRCAVYFSTEEQPHPELLKWWNWKDRTLTTK